jgi:hypothetical protein
LTREEVFRMLNEVTAHHSRDDDGVVGGGIVISKYK